MCSLPSLLDFTTSQQISAIALLRELSSGQPSSPVCSKGKLCKCGHVVLNRPLYAVLHLSCRLYQKPLSFAISDKNSVMMVFTIEGFRCSLMPRPSVHNLVLTHPNTVQSDCKGCGLNFSLLLWRCQFLCQFQQPKLPKSEQ